MTTKEMLRTAMEQSAYDINCRPEDFLCGKPVLTEHKLTAFSKKIYSEPTACHMISYGSNVVASAKKEYADVTDAYIHKFEGYRCFETPQLYWLDRKLAPYRQRVCIQAEYYLPDTKRMSMHPCAYELKILHQSDFADLYKPQWGNALCEKRKELDILGVGAYDKKALVGFAACSMDCEKMWQIGVDVLPEYRRRGIAAALTGRLAAEILERGKVPFYCTAWSNIRSARNAVACGFFPAWAELIVKPQEISPENE